MFAKIGPVRFHWHWSFKFRRYHNGWELNIPIGPLHIDYLGPLTWNKPPDQHLSQPTEEK